MTFLQSHLLRLSGNRIFAIFLLILLIPACKTKPPDDGVETVIIKDDEVITKGKVDTLKSGAIVDIESGDTVLVIKSDTLRPGKGPAKISSIRVAMLLPLRYDTLFEVQQELRKITNRDQEFNISLPNETNSSLDFYLGYIAALSGLRQRDIHVELKLFDTEGSSQVTQNILDTAGLASYDMIVGPMFNGPARLVADYAKESRVWHVLPFSPSASITSDNPYHIKVNPGIDIHLKTMIEHIGKYHWDAKLIIPYQSAVSMESELKTEIEEIVELHNINHPDSTLSPEFVSVYEEEGRRTFTISSYISETDSNVILLPSFDPGFIQNITRQLSKQDRDHGITLYGMPNWSDYEEISLDNLNKLDYHFTREYWFDEENKIFKDLTSQYKKEMNREPSGYFFLGYDLGRFLTGLWQNHGNKFESFLCKERYEGLYGNYKFAPDYSQGEDKQKMEIDHIANQALFILRYLDYEIVKAE
jgi:hypothetical protein